MRYHKRSSRTVMTASKLLVFCFLSLLQTTHSASTFDGAFYYETSDDQTIPIDESDLVDNAGEAVERQMLQLLGLPEKPKHVDFKLRTNAAPQFMLHLYQSIQKQAGLEQIPTPSPEEEHLGPELRNISYDTEQEATKLGDSDIVISFVNVAGERLGIEHEADKRFYFELDDVPETAVLTDTEFRLYKEKSRHLEQNYFITVFKIGSVHLQDHSLSMLDSLMVSGSYEGWLLFNVTEALQSWLRNDTSSTNNGIYIQVMSATGEEVLPHRIGIVNRHGEAAKQGFMVAFFWSEVPLSPILPNMHQALKKTVREKRSTTSWTQPYYWEKPVSPYSRKACQRRRLHVNFDKIHLNDWIIAPLYYEAFYCEGECSFPLNAHMNATNHAIVQTLVSLIHPKKFPKACCAPKELSEITVLYFDEKSNVVMKRYSDMVVQSCGCH